VNNHAVFGGRGIKTPSLLSPGPVNQTNRQPHCTFFPWCSELVRLCWASELPHGRKGSICANPAVMMVSLRAATAQSPKTKQARFDDKATSTLGRRGRRLCEASALGKCGSVSRLVHPIGPKMLAIFASDMNEHVSQSIHRQQERTR
jgi:hypothetical protein